MSSVCIINDLNDIAERAEELANDAKEAVENGEEHESFTCKDVPDTCKAIKKEIADRLTEWMIHDGNKPNQKIQDLLDSIVVSLDNLSTDAENLPVIVNPFQKKGYGMVSYEDFDENYESEFNDDDFYIEDEDDDEENFQFS